MNVIYHKGLLMRDRLFDAEVDAAANNAWKLQTRGKVVLVQRRVKPGVCEYLAIPVEQ